MKPVPRLLFCVIALIPPNLATAAPDPRIRFVDYEDAQVIHVDACPGFQTTVTLGADEAIENMGLGNSDQWQVTPNRRGNVLFVKPVADHALTNLSVISTEHRYDFELVSEASDACTRGDVVYDIRFRYAGATPSTTTVIPEKRNQDYAYSGDKDLIPFRAFDDGKSTWLQWSPGVVPPAVYTVAEDKSETLINFTMVDEYLVIGQISPFFILRRGQRSARLTNEQFRHSRLDASSPRSKGWLAPHKPTGPQPSGRAQ